MSAALFWFVFSGLYTSSLSLEDIEYRESKGWLKDSAWQNLISNFYSAMYCQSIAQVFMESI